MRTWARENGHEVSDRARIPTSVIEAYHSAH
ncbi:Lsr2 family DNA-binding protein [Barrientosiimonas humi]